VDLTLSWAAVKWLLSGCLTCLKTDEPSQYITNTKINSEA